MRVRLPTVRAVALTAGALAACGGPLEVRVRLVEPCDQAPLDEVDFLRFEPRGEGIDGPSQASVEAVSGRRGPPLDIPLAPDFQLLVTGHATDFDAPPTVFGVSRPVDLSLSGGATEVPVPVSVLGRFHRATRLDRAPGAPDRCADPRRARFGATATPLSGGRVLVVGGARYDRAFLEYVREVELFDPRTGAFRVVGRLDDALVRRDHTASRLDDGRVLVAGGRRPSELVPGAEEAVRSAFVIDARDPAAVEISGGGLRMVEARSGHGAARLVDGRVVLVGGRTIDPAAPTLEASTLLDTVEVFDPRLGTFGPVAAAEGQPLALSAPRWGARVLALPGRADWVVVGGLGVDGPSDAVEVLRLAGGVGSRTVAPSRLGGGAVQVAAALTQDGDLLVSGGSRRPALVTEAAPGAEETLEVWGIDARTGVAERLCFDRLRGARAGHTVSVLGRRVLFAGGRDAEGRIRDDAEVGDLATRAEMRRTGRCLIGAPEPVPMGSPRVGHRTVHLTGTAELLVVGGIARDPGVEQDGRAASTAILYSDFARTLLLAPRPRAPRSW